MSTDINEDLWTACKNGNLKQVLEWVFKGADINETCKEIDGAERTPLQYATNEGHLDIIQALLESGADVNKGRIDTGATPLLGAAQRGHLEVTKLLIEFGANINQATTDLGITPLYGAAQRGHLELVKLLVEHNANLNVKSKAGKTALDIATEKQRKKVIEFLKQEDNRGLEYVTQFYNACQRGDLLEVENWLSRGLDPNVDDGYAPMHYASSGGNLKIVKVLLEHGAAVNLLSSIGGATPIFIAAQEGHLEVVKLLIDSHADVNLADLNGTTPLYIAAQFDHLDVVKLLVDSHADVNQATSNEWTPLCIAAEEGHLKIVKLLLEHKANVHFKAYDGRTALDIATKKGHKDVVNFLKLESEILNTKNHVLPNREELPDKLESHELKRQIESLQDKLKLIELQQQVLNKKREQTKNKLKPLLERFNKDDLM